MAKISDKFLSGKGLFMDLVTQKEFGDLVKFGLKPEYLNSLPDAKAISARWKKYIMRKNKGGQVKTTEVKSFKRGGQFKGTF